IAEDHRGIPRFQIARHNRAILAAAVTNVTDVQIEMIAPKERRHSESLTRAENVARCGLALALSHDPVLDAHTARARVGPTGEVEFHAVVFVSFANAISQFAPKNLLQRQRSFSDDCDFKFALAQRCRHFQANEACADDYRALRVFRFLYDTPAVAQRPQITNV